MEFSKEESGTGLGMETKCAFDTGINLCLHFWYALEKN